MKRPVATGQVWLSKSSPRTMKILETDDEGVLIEVERMIPGRGIEPRERRVFWDDVPALLLGYKKQTKR